MTSLDFLAGMCAGALGGLLVGHSVSAYYHDQRLTLEVRRFDESLRLIAAATKEAVASICDLAQRKVIDDSRGEN